MTKIDVVGNVIGYISLVSGVIGLLIGVYAEGDQELKMALIVVGPIASLAGIMILRDR